MFVLLTGITGHFSAVGRGAAAVSMSLTPYVCGRERCAACLQLARRASVPASAACAVDASWRSLVGDLDQPHSTGDLAYERGPLKRALRGGASLRVSGVAVVAGAIVEVVSRRGAR